MNETEEVARLKFDIWRELMNQRPTIYPSTMGGAGREIPVPDAVGMARSALLTFAELYGKPAKKKR